MQHIPNLQYTDHWAIPGLAMEKKTSDLPILIQNQQFIRWALNQKKTLTRQTDRNKNTNRKTEIQTDTLIKTQAQTYRNTIIKTQAHRQTHRHTDRHTDLHALFTLHINLHMKTLVLHSPTNDSSKYVNKLLLLPEIILGPPRKSVSDLILFACLIPLTQRPQRRTVWWKW